MALMCGHIKSNGRFGIVVLNGVSLMSVVSAVVLLLLLLVQALVGSFLYSL